MAKSRILIVDDEQGMLDVCGETLSELPEAEIVLEKDPGRALPLLREEIWDLLIADIRMPALNGIDLLRHARRCDPDLVVLMLTAFPNVDTAVESMKLGAADYLSKPFDPEALLGTCSRLLETKRLRDEHRLLERQVEGPHRFADIIGKSPPMQAVYEIIGRVAPSDLDVLITGETGTGKELVARAIHQGSPQKKKRFVPVDCGAIPEALMESEFFGHERGAFTGADARNLGLMEFAHGGTLFLDEIGQLPLNLQAKLLRALQERRIRRVGGREEIGVEVRVVAATSLDLQEEIEKGRFRTDLYYRINVAQVDLPPLRQRPGDVTLLSTHFTGRIAQKLGCDRMEIDPEALEVLAAYHWPGNVRELENTVRRAVTLSRGKVLTVDDLPSELVASAGQSPEALGEGLYAERTQFERSYLSKLLERCHGDVTCAASEARLPRATFYRFLKKHDIDPNRFRDTGSG